MARYYFTVVDGVELEDPEGSEHESVSAAIDEARLMAEAILADGLRGGLDRRKWSIRVLDAAGEIVAVVPFSDVVLGSQRGDQRQHAPGRSTAD